MIIKYLPNPLDKANIDYLDCFYAPVPLSELLAQIDFELENHIAIINGKKVDWNFIPAADDDVIISADLSGGTNGWIGAGLMVLGTALTVGSVGALGYVGAGLIAAGAGLLVGSLIQPPTLNRNIDALSNSPTYNFAGIENTYGEGGVVPLVYGRHKVGGQIIEAYLDDNEYLTAVIALSEGEIGGIVENDQDQHKIFISDQPIHSYGDNASYSWRNGKSNQTSMVLFGEGLSQIHHHYAFTNIKLTKNRGSYLHSINNKNSSRVKVTIGFPFLYTTDNSGNVNNAAVAFQLRASIDKEYWVKSIEKSIDNKSKSALTLDIILDLPANARWIEITRLTHDSSSFNVMNDSYLKSITETEDAKIAYNNTAVLGLKVKANDRVSGGMPNINTIIDGIKVCSVKNIVEKGDYTKKTSSNPGDILFDILTNTRYGVGYHLNQDQIDMVSFYEYADWCDEQITFEQYDPYSGVTKTFTEKRYELNLVIDVELEAVELLNTICRATRSIIYWHNDKLRVVMDRPGIPRQLFGMGNIIKDSYVETYVGLKDIPNQVEAKYLDEANGYKQQTISVFDSSRTNEPVSSRVVNLYGVTKYTQAKRELIFALKKARSIRRFITFAVGIEGVICEVGDIILFSHDTPEYGYSGRVLSTDTNLIYLDRELEVNAGVRYTILFSINNDLVKHEFVADKTGLLDKLEITGHSIAPDTVYSAGHMTAKPIPLRILNIRQTTKFIVEFECEEYNEEIYSISEDIIIEVPNYSGLGVSDRWVVGEGQATPMPDNPPAGFSDIPSPIEEIKLTEIVEQKPDRGMQVNIRVDFSRSELPLGSLSSISHYAIDICIDDDKWFTAGTTKATSYTVYGVYTNKTYKVAVKPYTIYGITNNNFIVSEITPSGIAPIPYSPEIINITQNNGLIMIKWLPVVNTTVTGYEIRRGDDWVFAKKVTTTAFECTATFNATAVGTVTYLVSAININGIYSKPASVCIDVYDVNKNIIFESNSTKEGFTGICHNMVVSRNSLKIADTRGSYIAGYIAFEAPVKSKVSVDYDIVGRYRSNLSFRDAKFSFSSTHASMAWSKKINQDCLKHKCEISTFTTLPAYYTDVIRLAGYAESVNGSTPVVSKNIEYANGTFHKGILQGNVSQKLIYRLQPSDSWTLFFRYSTKNKKNTGVIISLDEADVICLGQGTYKFLSSTLLIDHADEAELLFCISSDGSKTYFAVGDTNAGKYVSCCADVFDRFSEIKI